MNTIYLSDEEVAAYLRDLIDRLGRLDGGMPRTWCPIGPSGLAVAQLAMRDAGDGLASQILIMPITYDRSNRKISFPDEANPRNAVEGKRILLIDGAVHSGGTLGKAYEAVESLGALEISSYSVVVRRGTAMVPNFFGLLVRDHDRVHFLKTQIPNNRLLPFGCVRRLSNEDLEKPMIETGASFIDKFTWSDFAYEMRVDRGRKTYLYERNADIQGFISFRLAKPRALLVDTLGVDKRFHGQGIGGYLLRWAETYARHKRCRQISLWAVEERTDFYAKHDFQPRREDIVLDGIRFFLMSKKLLYNLPDDDLPC